MLRCIALVAALAVCSLANAESPQTIKLGEDALLDGISAAGKTLSLDEIAEWLADPQRHQTLNVELPEGLADAASNVFISEDNPLTEAKIELGRQLFFDKRLSSDETVSCATCHDPDHGYAAATQFGVGIGGAEGPRNTPVAYNRLLSKAQFWDGRAATLEDQAVGPIASAIEMGNSHEACVAVIAKIPGYRLQFAKVFGSGSLPSGLSIDNVGRALASFERVLVTGPSPWDRHQPLARFQAAYAEDLEDLEYLEEDDPELYEEYQTLLPKPGEPAISESALRGGELFLSEQIGCAKCHAGANFTDELYHNLGVGWDQPGELDLGRFDTTGEAKDRGAFKTPTLRNVAQSAPYMHDGSQKTLEEVIDWYDKGGHPNPYLSDKIKPLKLTPQEKADLVAFMYALTGALPEVARDRLPE